MKIKDLMTTKIISVKPTDTVEQVVGIIAKYRFTGVPVVDESGKLLGVISERDFIAPNSKLFLPTYIKLITEFSLEKDDERIPESVQKIITTTARDIMNKEPITAHGEMTLEELAELFGEKRVNPVPVVDDKGLLVGIISRSDLIKLFSEKQLKIE